MIGLPANTRVWIVAGHTDMRKGFDGLVRISANVTGDFGSVTASEPMLCCAGKIVGTMSY